MTMGPLHTAAWSRGSKNPIDWHLTLKFSNGSIRFDPSRSVTTFGCKSRKFINNGIDGPKISASNRATFNPHFAEAMARFTAVVDFPTPPFPEATAMMCLQLRRDGGSGGFSNTFFFFNAEVLASTKEEDSAEEKKEEYLNRKQKQRLLRDATTLREEDAHAALLIRSRNSKQLFIFVQPTVSRFSPEISFKMSHKKGTNSREIQAHHSFLLLRRFCARFFLSLFLLVLIIRFVSSFCEK
jgi:hypothetical protein